MRLRPVLVSGLLLALTSVLGAHDLFLTLREYFVPPNTDLRITALNGTFSTSENSIDRIRIADLSLVTPRGRQQLDTAVVSAEGTRTAIDVHPQAQGTYVAGMSIKPSEIDLTRSSTPTSPKKAWARCWPSGGGRASSSRRRASDTPSM